MCYRLHLIHATAAMLLAATSLCAEETQSVKAGSLSLKVPATWKKGPATQFRLAQFKIPSDAGECELVVFYFGGNSTGGVKANIDRWIGQFQEEKREVALRQGESSQGKLYWAEVSGTWKKPDGPPFARKTIDTPGSRVVGAIVVAKKDDKDDYYFLKLSGKDKAVTGQIKALQTAIGAKASTLKAFDLKDAPN